MFVDKMVVDMKHPMYDLELETPPTMPITARMMFFFRCSVMGDPEKKP